MRKLSVFLLAFILFLPSSRLFADIAAIHADRLPQETAVLDALDDARQLEPFSHSWTSNWKYAISKEDVATRLGKDLGFLTSALKSHPDNAELSLLAGLVARYAYNLDIKGSYETAMSALGEAQKLAPADVRPLWFRATLECQTMETKSGAGEFLSIEDSYSWDQLPVAFWDDYMECASVTNMPAHLLRAADHLEKLHAPSSEMRAFLANGARKRFDPYDPAKTYEPKEVWSGNSSGEDAVFTSTLCGARIHAHGDWSVDQLGLGNGSCIAYFHTGAYKANEGDLRPGILLLAKQPEKNQTLEDFSKKYSTKGTFEPYELPKCPAGRCIALKGVQPGMYGKNGDGHGRVVVFEREQPEFPGLIFESPLEIPKPGGSGGPTFYRPGQVKERIPGKLYYLVLLDTAASIEGPALKDFDFFVQTLTVE